MWGNEFASLTMTTRQSCRIAELRALRAHPTWEEFREAQQAIRVLFQKADAKKMRICQVYDLREMGMLTPAMIQEWIQLFEELRSITERIVVCTVLVFDAPAIREALNVFLTNYKRARPVHVCASMDEAHSKCVEESQ